MGCGVFSLPLGIFRNAPKASGDERLRDVPHCRQRPRRGRVESAEDIPVRNTGRARSLTALALLLAGLAAPLLLFPRVPPRPGPEPFVWDADAEPVVEAEDPGLGIDEPLPDGAVARLGTTRFRHAGRVQVATVSPDGKFIATAEEGRPVHLWDAATGRVLRDLSGNSRLTKALAFSPDGRTLAAAGDEVLGWDAATGRELLRVRDGESESYHALAFSPDGKMLAVGTGGYVVGGSNVPSAVLLLEVPTGNKVDRLGEVPDMVEGVAYAPDGKRVASASRDRTVRLWDARTGRELRRYGKADEPQTRVAFSPDGKSLAATDWRGRTTVWDAATGTERWRTEDAGHPLGTLAFSPDGSLLLTGTPDQAAHLYDAATGRKLAGLGDLAGEVQLGAFTPDGAGLVLWGGDNAVHFWDLGRGRERRFGVGHGATVRAVAVGSDGRVIASAGSDGVRLWDARSGRHLRRLGGPDTGWSVAVSPDGRVAAGGSDGKVRVWEARTGRVLREFKSPDSWVSQVAFSPDGKRLFVAGTFLVRTWDLKSGELVREFGERPGWADTSDRPILPMSHLAVGPDGKTAATRGSGGLRLWDVASGRESRPAVDGKRSGGPVAFSPDGKALACGWWEEWECGLCLWNMTTGREASRVQLEDRSGCKHLAFAPDGRTIAGACGKCVRVWAVPDWREVAVFRGHAGEVSQVAFTPDGKRLVSCSSDTTLLVWDLSRVAKP